ncbi:uncharacterized protein LOC126044944 isoform X1 [Accipiter gentilis]|nr:uncharacterized protein LOC126044944 isoform X1 [Accipiter gentilis]
MGCRGAGDLIRLKFLSCSPQQSGEPHYSRTCKDSCLCLVAASALTLSYELLCERHNFFYAEFSGPLKNNIQFKDLGSAEERKARLLAAASAPRCPFPSALQGTGQKHFCPQVLCFAYDSDFYSRALHTLSMLCDGLSWSPETTRFLHLPLLPASQQGHPAGSCLVAARLWSPRTVVHRVGSRLPSPAQGEQRKRCSKPTLLLVAPLFSSVPQSSQI